MYLMNTNSNTNWNLDLDTLDTIIITTFISSDVRRKLHKRSRTHRLLVFVHYKQACVTKRHAIINKLCTI